MSADQHLSRAQFPSMPIEHILRLPSADAPAGGTVADVMPRKEKDLAEDRHGEFGPLRESMRTQGQTWPIHIDDEMGVGNGHHRIAIARQLGWTHMQYSNDVEDTGEEFAGLKLHDIGAMR